MSRLVTIFFLVISLNVFAQQQEWGDGEIKDVEIEIVKDRVITLPKANRLFDKIPPRPAEPIKPEISYTFKAFNFNSPELNPIIRPLKLKESESAETYRGYISAGYGNYATPYLDAFITSKPNKNKLVGARAYYNRSGKGPVDEKNSASGIMGVSAFAQTFSKELSFTGNIGFENRLAHFYGYPDTLEVSRDTIKQSFSLFTAGLELANARKKDFSYKLGSTFSFLKDNFSAKETIFDLTFSSAYKISDNQSINLRGSYAILNRKDEDIASKVRNLFTVNGYYSFYPVDKLKLDVGATMAIDNDTINSKKIHFYPDVKVTYPLNGMIDFVGALTGGMDKVSLQSLTNENMWLNPAVPLFHTNRTFDLQAGIRARLGSKVLAGAGLSFASLKNMYFFVNDPMDQSKFTVLYDDGATIRTNVYGSILYTHANVARVSLQGDFFSYSTDQVSNAWHKPGYRVVMGASYNIYEKIVLSVDAIAQGNMKARAFNAEASEFKSVNLDAAFDLSFRAEYLVSDTFSGWLQFNNITGSKYPLFLNYPVRGLQVMAGITWKIR